MQRNILINKNKEWMIQLQRSIREIIDDSILDKHTKNNKWMIFNFRQRSSRRSSVFERQRVRGRQVQVGLRGASRVHQPEHSALFRRRKGPRQLRRRLGIGPDDGGPVGGWNELLEANRNRQFRAEAVRNGGGARSLHQGSKLR